MPNEIVPLFLNPTAGRGRARKNARDMLQLLDSFGIVVNMIESSAVGDLEQRVYEHATAGAERIIVAGGDGSVHEAVNGIIKANSETALGLIPIGTGNDFAKACAFPLDWKKAASVVGSRLNATEPARRVDVGRMNERFFANGAGIGFDAKINRIARKYDWPIGHLVYFVAVLEGLVDGVITPNVSIRYENYESEGPVTLVNISNGPWVGGMFYVAPMAMNDDGRLDLIIASPVSRARVLTLLPKLIKGTHIDEADIRHDTVEAVELTANNPVPSHLDGEVQPLQTSFKIEVLKDRLRLF